MMKNDIQIVFTFSPFAIWLIGFGLLLITIGLMHLNPAFRRWDVRSFQIMHVRLRRFSGFFGYIWPLGTTPVSVLLLLILYISSWQAGFAATLTYLIAAMMEAAIKLKVQRQRPFETLPDVQMGQPRIPHDPSHPSGDSMRVWFLALIFPLFLGLHWPVLVFTILSAITLSLGRIALGVHYPLDIISGSGLGIIAAGSAVVSYQIAVVN